MQADSLDECPLPVDVQPVGLVLQVSESECGQVNVLPSAFWITLRNAGKAVGGTVRTEIVRVINPGSSATELVHHEESHPVAEVEEFRRKCVIMRIPQD